VNRHPGEIPQWVMTPQMLGDMQEEKKKGRLDLAVVLLTR
jgi:hypothetical protein